MKEAFWIGMAVATIVPAVLAASVPRRRLVAVMTAWFLSPVFVYMALIAWETLTHPAGGNRPGAALYGFALVTPLLAPFWLMAFLAGFGLGAGTRFLLRPLRPRRTVSPPAPPAPPPAAATPVMPRPLEAPLWAEPGWRPVHIGFDGDAVRIGGLEVWRHEWRPEPGPPVRLPHPTHPQQMHGYEVFLIGSEPKPVRFAAAELSNGVWGFHLRQDDTAVVQAMSQDGSLRYEHRPRPQAAGRPGPPLPVLTDARSGQVLVDGAAWEFGNITSNADGTLFLRLQQKFFDVMFRIDPATREFWNHGESGPRQPLTGLAAEMEQARLAIEGAEGEAAYRQIAPDAVIRIDLATVEWANSHWVNSPRVVEIGTGRVVLDLWGTDWDATAEFPRYRCTRLALRSYRRRCHATLEIDMGKDLYRVVEPCGPDGSSPAAPLAWVAAALKATAASSATGSEHLRRTAASPWAAWRAALLIAAGAAVAIAGATGIAIRLDGPGRSVSGPLARVPQLDAPPR